MKTSNNPACVDLPACFHCWVWACCLNICPNYRAHFISAVLSSQVTCYVCPPPWNRMPSRCPIYVIRSFSAICLSSWRMNSAWPISLSPAPNSLKVSYFEWAECCLILQTCCCWLVLTVLIQLGNKVKTPKDWVPQAKIIWVAMTPKWILVCVFCRAPHSQPYWNFVFSSWGMWAHQVIPNCFPLSVIQVR